MIEGRKGQHGLQVQEPSGTGQWLENEGKTRHKAYFVCGDGYQQVTEGQPNAAFSGLGFLLPPA